MTESSLKESVVTSLLWKFCERGGRALVELLVQVILARLLAPEQFGALAIMLVFVNLGNVFVQSGLNTALVQDPNIDDDDCSTVYWLSLGVSIVIYAIVFLAAPYVSSFYGVYGLVWPLRALALILLINAYNAVQVAIVQRSLEMRKIFKSSLWSVLVSASVGICVAVSGGGLWALVLQQLTCQFCNCIFLSLQVKWHPRIVFNFRRLCALFSFGWKLLVSGILDQSYRAVSDLVIGKQFSVLDLGLVSQGKKYPSALGSMLDGAIQPVMLSAVSRLQSDVERVKRLVRRSLKTSTFIIVPIMVCFALCAEPFVRLLLGEQWLSAVPFLQMYCFVYALLPIHSTNLQALNGLGRSDLFLKLELLKKGIGLINLFIMAFIFQDIYLMVGSYIFTGVLSTIVNAWPNKRIIEYSYLEQLRDICPAIILSTVAGALAWGVSLLMLPDIVMIFVQVIVMAVAYLGLAKMLQVEELDYLLNTAKEMLRSHRN